MVIDEVRSPVTVAGPRRTHTGFLHTRRLPVARYTRLLPHQQPRVRDGRQPAYGAGMPDPRTVYLLRHGQSQWNAQRRIQGQTAHVPLTALGLRQAESAAEGLAGSGAVLVVTSDLRRAADTARVVAGRLNVGVLTSSALREQALGIYEGRPSDEVLGEVGAEVKGDPSWRPPGGESLLEVYARVWDFFARLPAAAPDGPLVVVTHGDTARAVSAVLRGCDPAGMATSVPGNGEVTRLDWLSAAAGVGHAAHP